MTSSTENNLPLAGRVALVTGGAKRLGRAIALRLGREGADLVVHYGQSESEAHATVAELESFGRRAVAIQADLTNLSAIRELFAKAANQFGRLDILVNSAANFIQTDFAATTEEVWDASLDTNLKGPFFCSQAAAPLLKESRGVIINMSDMGGILAWADFLPHSIAKAGVIHLTKGLAKALAPDVRVNAIAPGTITMSGDPKNWEIDFARRAPLGRTGTPAEIADAVLFLIRSEFMTGQVLIIDGGRVL
ncbi:MAG TPA: SDR family oxidoreductase [Candidatus Dormibacteraeota bacterium]|nr:SDR family oxidoreductase [Candidatus Dormibacteraeota bacterium]